MTRLWFVALMSVGGTLTAFGIYGCQESEPTKLTRELCVSTEGGVKLFDVQVKFGEQTIPFGVTTHFGKSWFPVSFDVGEEILLEVHWQDGAQDSKQKSAVSIKGLTEEVWREFDGVELIYAKPDGWIGKVLRRNGSE